MKENIKIIMNIENEYFILYEIIIKKDNLPKTSVIKYMEKVFIIIIFKIFKIFMFIIQLKGKIFYIYNKVNYRNNIL